MQDSHGKSRVVMGLFCGGLLGVLPQETGPFPASDASLFGVCLVALEHALRTRGSASARWNVLGQWRKLLRVQETPLASGVASG